MRIDILIKNPKHSLMPWLELFISLLDEVYECRIVHNSGMLRGGDFLFLVSCHELIGSNIRSRYEYVLVLHASDLPSGRGWSPHVWQILEGNDNITVGLLNTANGVDTGGIRKKEKVTFDGHELYDEINVKIFQAEIHLLEWAIANCSIIARPVHQSGNPSYYRKRSPEDSRIDPRLSIECQFDLLRVADPARYPAFFEMRNKKYKIMIEKMES